MEQSLFLFLFLITTGILFLAEYKVRNPTDKFLLFVVSGVLFLALMIQSLNIEYILYNPNTEEFISYRLAEHGFEFMIPFAICFIASSFSLISVFINIVPIWNKNFKKKDLKGF